MHATPNIETVYQAISTLYNAGSDPSSKEKASVWLGEFQNSIYAWEISDHLLRDRRNIESCYFAAQTMRSKIQYAFHELPESSYSSLQESLKSHLRNCDVNVNRAIVTQLALAFADLNLQVLSWRIPVLELINDFMINNRLLILLELLTLLAEEVNSRRLRIGANRRKQLQEDFLSQSDVLLKFLNQSIDNGNHGIISQCFRCLASWLSLTAISSSVLAKDPMLTKLFQILANHDTPKSVHDDVTECAVQILYLVENFVNNSELARTVFPKVHSLQPAYQMAVARDDSEKLQNFCRIFTELIESVLPIITSNPDDELGSPKSLDLLLDCVGHYDYSLAEITFNVWYRLSELVYQKDSEQLNSLFRPYINRLICALYKHCRFDTDYDSIPLDNDELSDFRRKVSEVIKDVVFIVGSANLFSTMFNVLKRSDPQPSWDEAEAALFIMSIVAKNVIPEDEDTISELLCNLSSLPDSAHVAIRHSAIHLIGQMADWFAFNTNLLEKTIHFLMRNLKHDKLCSISAQSIELLCNSTARSSVADYVNEFLQLCFHLDEKGAPPDEAGHAILRSTAVLISYAPNELYAENLKRLCLKQSESLVRVLNLTATTEDGKENRLRQQPVILLDRLTSIFRNLGPAPLNGNPPICTSVVTDLLPVILQTCQQYETDGRVVEHGCKTLRFMIRCMGLRVLPLLQPLVEKMFCIYQRHPHSCFLYLGSVLVDEFGQFDEFVPGLTEMLKAFVGATFKFLEQPGVMQQSPDSVDDLFRLSLRFVQKAPRAFFTSEVCRPLFQCALVAVTLDHREANESVAKFLVQSITFARDGMRACPNEQCSKDADQVVKENGERLVATILHGSIFCLSTMLIKEVAEVLWALMNFDVTLFGEWLGKALKMLPQKATLTATDEQMQEFHAAVLKTNDSRTIQHLLKDFTRLYR